MKKKLLALVLALVLVFAMTACGGGNDNQSAADDSSSSAAAENSVADDDAAVTGSDEGALGDYVVKINDAQIGTDWEGNKVIVISYDFTNNSDDAASAMWALVTKAFQNGIELESAYGIEEDWYDEDTVDKQIKPGATITGCQAAFVLDDNSDVEFEVTELISFSDEVIAKTFSIE